MTIIQILLIIFFILAIARVYTRYRAEDVSLASAGLWFAFWLGAGVVTLLPNATFYLARIVGVGRGADVVVYFSIAILFFVMFKILVAQKKIEKNITTITRELALRNGKKEDDE